MTKGKPWSVEEEKQLKDLVATKNSVSVIAKKLGKTSDAVVQKCYRLGLEVEGVKKKSLLLLLLMFISYYLNEPAAECSLIREIKVSDCLEA
jgi:hypothetical protein